MGSVKNCTEMCSHPQIERTLKLKYGYYNPTTIDGVRYGAKLSSSSAMFNVVGGVIGTHKFFQWFDEDGKRIGEKVKIITDDNKYVEDIRIFVWNSVIYGIGTNSVQPVLVEFPHDSNNFPILENDLPNRVIDYKDPNPIDKNWTPLMYENELFFHTDTTGDSLMFRKYDEDTNYASISNYIDWTPPDSTQWRGGTNWLDMGDGKFWGYLHNCQNHPLRRRIYRSVLLEVDWVNQTSRTSKVQCFDEEKHSAIQFVTSLHFGEDGYVGVGFGQNDRNAFFNFYRRDELFL